MSGGSKAPAGYQPKQQAQADSGYMSNLSSLAAGGQNLVNTAIPGYQGIYQATQANPYYSGAQAGAGQAANAGQYFAMNNMDMGSALQSMASQIPGYQAQMQAYASPIQGYQQNLSALASPLQGYQSQIAGMVPTLQGYQSQVAGMAPTLQGYQQNLAGMASPIQGYQNQIMQTAFDPQQALYNRNFQQQMDQQNAINAMYGVAGSPYGAGVAGQTANNFNIDWQNAQLARQAQGASAFGSLGSTAEGLYGSAANIGNTAAGMYGQATNIGQAASGLYGQAAGIGQDAASIYGASAGLGATGAGILGNAANLDSLASGLYGQASNLNQSGIDVAYQTSQLPNAGYLQQLAANQAALDALVSGTSGAYGLTQGAIGDYGSYLKLGQSATANAQNAASINNQQSAGGLAGLGKLAGAGLTFFGGPAGAAAGSVLAGG